MQTVKKKKNLPEFDIHVLIYQTNCFYSSQEVRKI